MQENNNKVFGLPVRIWEDDPKLRQILENTIFTSSEPILEFDGEATFHLIGPTFSLERLPKLPSANQVLVVLCRSEDLSRPAEALALGAHDAVVWQPSGEAELKLRLKRLARQLERRSDERKVRRDLEAILDLSEALTMSEDVDATLYQIAYRMAEVMHSDRCSIILLDDELTRAFVVADSEDKSINDHLINLTGYPEIFEVVKTEKHLVIDNVHQEPLFDEVREIIRTKPVGNTALFPVKLNQRVQGILMVRGGDVRTEGLTPRQIRFATIVANATAIALRNAKTFRSIRERTERLLNARIRAERRLRQIEKYQRFFDLAGDGLAIVDGKGQFLFANKAALEIMEFSKNDLSQLRLSDIVHDDELVSVTQLLNSFRIGEYKSTIDLCVLTANGHQKTLSISTASLDPNIKTDEIIHEKTAREYQSQEVAAIISMRDVTETRVIETELKRTKEFLENVIDSSVDAIIATDMTGTVLIYNDGAERILGYLPDEIVEKLNVKDLYVDDAASTIMRAFWSEEHGGMGKYDGGRHEILSKDGQRVPISISAALIFHQSEPIASVGIFRDLRERIRMENELTSAQKKLETSERQKAVMELAGAAAHELSQPLTTIMGSAELLRLKLPFDEKYDKLLSRIVVQSERMAELLAKIGQITRYETKPYLEKTNIIDLDASIEKRDEK